MGTSPALVSVTGSHNAFEVYNRHALCLVQKFSQEETHGFCRKSTLFELVNLIRCCCGGKKDDSLADGHLPKMGWVKDCQEHVPANNHNRM